MSFIFVNFVHEHLRVLQIFITCVLVLELVQEEMASSISCWFFDSSASAQLWVICEIGSLNRLH